MQNGKFLQSNEWAKFQESLGRKTWRIDGALIIKIPLVFGLSYLYSPKGPAKITDNLLAEIKKIAKKERVIFFRCEPQNAPPKNFLKTKDIQPAKTQLLDLIKSENELLAEMHQKTRYNIRLAKRKGVKITNYELRITNNNFDEFYNLLRKISARQKITLHPKNYYQKLLNKDYHNCRDRDNYDNELFIAYYQNEPTAAAIVNFYKDTAAYLHGGSDEKYKNLMAPHLLHWEIIKTAKTRGFHYYDWWGVDEKKWPGLTRFKKSFGGREVVFPGTYDLPLDKLLYFLYKIFRR